MNVLSQLTEIGKLSTTYGVKGEFKIQLNSNISFLKKMLNYQLFLKSETDDFDIYKVVNQRLINNRLIIKLDKIDTIDQAKKYVSNLVFVKTSENIVEVKKTLHDFKVYSGDEYIGDVIEIMSNGVYELIKIKASTDFWIPVVDNFIDKICWKTQVIKAKNLKEIT